MTEKDKEKAGVLAEHFSEAFTGEPAGDIPTLPSKQPPALTDTEFTVEEIKAVKRLKRSKSPGPDGIHPSNYKGNRTAADRVLCVDFLHQSWKLNSWQIGKQAT